MRSHVLSFQRAAKAVSEILEESKNATTPLEFGAFGEETFTMEGHECVSILATWKIGTKHHSRMLHMKDDGTQAKILALFKGNASAEPLHKLGEEMTSYHHPRPRENFTAEL